MKSTDWSTRFTKAFSGEGDVFKIIEEFVAEGTKLVEERSKNSRGAFFAAAKEGALRESRAKWLAIQSRCPRLKSFGFEQLAKKIAA